MGIDKGNAAEQSIAKELYILNKKLDRLIDILAKKDAVLKIDESGITMAPKTVYKNDVPLCVDPENENEEGTTMVPVWQHGKTVMVPIDQVKIEDS